MHQLPGLDNQKFPSWDGKTFATRATLLGPLSLNSIVGITLTVALLSFVPELIWRKYV
jgi:hypothetical protein